MQRPNFERYGIDSPSPDEIKASIGADFDKLILNMQALNVPAEEVSNLQQVFAKALNGDKDAIDQIPARGELGELRKRIEYLWQSP